MNRILPSSRSPASAPYSCTPGTPKITFTPSIASCRASASPPVIRAIAEPLSSLSPAVSAEHDLAAHHRQHRRDRLDPRLVARHHVVRQYHQVRTLPGLK